VNIDRELAAIHGIWREREWIVAVKSRAGNPEAGIGRINHVNLLTLAPAGPLLVWVSVADV
jgi:hypothetical protein